MESCFWGFVLPVLVYISGVWCSAADTQYNLLDRVVSGDLGVSLVASQAKRGVRGCSIAYCWSVAVSCMQYKFRCKSMELFLVLCECRLCQCGIHAVALVTNQYTYAPCCWTSQYRMTFIPFLVSLWNDLGDPVFDVVVVMTYVLFIGLRCSLPTVFSLSYLFGSS